MMRIINIFERYFINIKNVFILIFISVLTSAIFVGLDFDIIRVNDNQLLYTYSTMAQVISSLFGLTLTAYVFYIGHVNTNVSNHDLNGYNRDASAEILKENHKHLLSISIISAFVIISCYIGTLFINQYGYIKHLSHFFVNSTGILFIFNVIIILLFGVALVNPSRLEDIKLKLSTKIISDFTGAKDSNNKVDIEKFLSLYNSITELIFEFSDKINSKYKHQSAKDQSNISDALKNLVVNKVINAKIFNIINNIRMYRNAIVHKLGISAFTPEIPLNIYTDMENIHDRIYKVYTIYDQPHTENEEWNRAIRDLHEFEPSNNLK